MSKMSLVEIHAALVQLARDAGVSVITLTASSDPCPYGYFRVVGVDSSTGWANSRAPLGEGGWRHKGGEKELVDRVLAQEAYMGNPTFKVGDIVKHTADFLRCTGWYTNVPKNGRVVEAEDPTTLPKGSPQMVEVQWCDREYPARILATNLMLASKPG